MAKPKIGFVVHGSLARKVFVKEDLARLERVGELRATESEEPIDEDAAIRLLQGCRVGVGSWRTPFPNARIVAACPDLELWVHAAGTVKHILKALPPDCPLRVSSCSPGIARCVAPMAVGELIIGLKRVLENASANRDGASRCPENSRNIFWCTIGIVGASNVGREAIRLLKPFGCRILLYDPYVSASEARRLGVELIADLKALCRASDAVSLHAPANESTRGMLGVEELAAMPDGCVFVNTARGAVVDEQALIAELKSGRISAFLDVTSPEPAAADSPLRGLPNVVLTSHISGAADPLVGRHAVDDVVAYLEGRDPVMVVTRDMLERVA